MAVLCCAGYDDPGATCWVTPFSPGYYGFAAYCKGDKAGSTTCTRCGIVGSDCCPGTKVGASLDCESRGGRGVCKKQKNGNKKCVVCGSLGKPCCGKGAQSCFILT